MATQTKDYENETVMSSQISLSKEEEVARANSPLGGSLNIDPSLIIPARYPMSRVIGKHKGDARYAEVWDRIIASRNADRVEDAEAE